MTFAKRAIGPNIVKSIEAPKRVNRKQMEKISLMAFLGYTLHSYYYK